MLLIVERKIDYNKIISIGGRLNLFDIISLSNLIINKKSGRKIIKIYNFEIKIYKQIRKTTINLSNKFKILENEIKYI